MDLLADKEVHVRYRRNEEEAMAGEALGAQLHHWRQRQPAPLIFDANVLLHIVQRVKARVDLVVHLTTEGTTGGLSSMEHSISRQIKEQPGPKKTRRGLLPDRQRLQARHGACTLVNGNWA